MHTRSDKARCGGMYQECWLKHQRLPKPPAQPDGSRGDAVGWTGGVIYDEQDEYVGGDGVAIMLHTKHGDLRLDLLPDLGPKSVRELRRMVARLPQPGGVCDGCKFYRSEKGFLLQGVIRAPGGCLQA